MRLIALLPILLCMCSGDDTTVEHVEVEVGDMVERVPYDGDELEEIATIETVHYRPDSTRRSEVSASIGSVADQFVMVQYQNMRERSVLVAFSGIASCYDDDGVLHITDVSVDARGSRPEMPRFTKVPARFGMNSNRCTSTEFDLEHATFGLYE